MGAADYLHKLGVGNPPECDCGADHMAVFECPSRLYRGPRIDCLTTPSTFVQWPENLKLSYQIY